ncbi:outer membrane beta-barrel protein [Alteromonas sp. 5E99-2]|uniref:outer membrane beta-barrel protein n=1 Tax=Alteromonas sp. 5E99-2 TaxID=2817683 RepID=UPI001A996BB4|nr:outer membrane beta-barrel protein [Alteromonas sp. 5E99-2]MBO1254234.1 outer membrane beta-barrel protein [Alteromonas sp. 5E99-2]
MKIKNNVIYTAIVLSTLSGHSFAQVENKPGLTASLEANLAYDDNIFRVVDELAESDSFIRAIPEVNFVTALGKHRVILGYQGDYAKFSDVDSADYDDHILNAQIQFDHSLRFSTLVGATYQDLHIDPGSLDRIELGVTEYDQFNRTKFEIGGSYGSAGSIGRLIGLYEYSDTNYTNNNLDFLDNEASQLSLQFFLKIAPSTSVYLSTSFQDSDYNALDGFTEIDNTYIRYVSGISWSISNLIDLDLSIGYQERDYDNETFLDIDGLAYSGEVSWQLTEHTVIEASALREAQDSTTADVGGFLRTEFTTYINHELSSLVTLKAGLLFGQDDVFFANTDGAIREDDRLAYELAVDYKLRNNLTVGAGYTHQERTSDVSIAEFDDNLIELTVKYDFEY